MVTASNKDIVADVKAAIDIVEIVGGYVDLKPAGGARFKALCPFHREKTPSFIVNRDRQTFHCFGCDKGGDIFTFVQDIEGINFREALDTLADRAGVQIERTRGGSGGDGDGQRKELQKLMASAARRYRSCLLDAEQGREGRAYLEGRALKAETTERFGVGYVPDGWQNIVDKARAEGFGDKLLEVSGLAKEGQHGFYDRFRNRLMFPIKDVSGKVVAFGGRALGDDPAKYINSPESPVYKKGRVLYGLHETRESLRATKEAILVEGYFDLLRCVDAGVENVVATCGTALTTEQAALLRRYVDSVLVVFDGDAAGVRAALRSVGILVTAGLSVRAMILPEGLDPDDFIRREGAEAFQNMASNAMDFLRFYVHTNGDRASSIEGRTALARELFAVLRDINDPIRQDEYVKVLAQELGLDAYRCRDEFAKFKREQERGGPAQRQTAPAPEVKISEHDCNFIAVLLQSPGLLREACDMSAKLEPTDGAVQEVLRALARGSESGILERLESEAARRLYSAAASAEDTWADRGEDLVREQLQGQRREALIHQREQIREEKFRAQRSNDDARLSELALKEIDINRQIERVGAA